MKKLLTFLLVLVLGASAALFYALPLPGEVPVLMYHFVGTKENAGEFKNFVSRESFERQMDFLRRFGYRVISAADYEAILKGKRKPRGREVVITFDDGNETFETHALPVLEKYKFPVTMFLVSESVRTGTQGSMRAETIKKMAAEHPWVNFESHTRTHPHLSLLTEEEMRAELTGSKQELEALLGREVPYLAYPSGSIDERVLAETQKAGYRLAFTTSYKKLKDLPVGIFALPREKISESSDNPLVFWFRISGLYGLFKRHRHFSLRSA